MENLHLHKNLLYRSFIGNCQNLEAIMTSFNNWYVQKMEYSSVLKTKKKEEMGYQTTKRHEETLNVYY